MSSNDLGDFGFGPFDFEAKFGHDDPDLKGLSSAAEFLLSGAMLGGSEGESPDTSATPPTPTLAEPELGKPRPTIGTGDSVCKHCGKSFNSVWYLKQHAVKHSSERPFKCKFCHKTYRFRSNLYQHKCPDRDLYMGTKASRAANRGKRKLSITSEAFSAEPAMRMSSINDRAIVTMPPEIAEVAAPRVLEPQLHIDSPWAPKEETKEPNFEEGLTEAQVEDYIARFRTKLHRCSKCRLFFPTREHLMRHHASHSDQDGRFKCPQCSESFTIEKDLAVHRGRHAPDSPHLCDVCSGSFVSRLALRRHISTCLSIPHRAPTSPSQPLSFIDQSPPHPTSASPTSAGLGAPLGGYDPGSWGDEAVEQRPTQINSSPTNSMELSAFINDSGYSSNDSHSPTKAPGSEWGEGVVSATDMEVDDSPDEFWVPLATSSPTGVAMAVRSPRIGPPTKRSLVSPRRVLSSRNEEVFLQPIQLPSLKSISAPLRLSKSSPSTYTCPRCFKHYLTQGELRKHLEAHEDV